jgi:hypothetical protein
MNPGRHQSANQEVRSGSKQCLEPYSTTEGPNYRNQRKAPCHICLVCKLGQHTLDHANVSVEHAIQAPTDMGFDKDGIVTKAVQIAVPKNTYLKTSAQKERESPKRMIDMIVPKRPHRRTGLRPM